ncbi:DUF3231 family protein [Gracilibacillus thailandensis]|uniref:DUF3231 family protein n=1 Tax=Gracilibacillus thailandensis TaxID=563735 RepID=A0A6N7R0N4_9BACI|nr:DUF3231 family protein [Gracilibacillus thailandensis]MRI66610.1 DUF3231 family protein [Gracilibacillus thailandensis]
MENVESEYKHNNIKLTSAEITNLWTAYLNDSAALCQLKYFEEKCEDEDIKDVIDYAITISEIHIRKLTELFNLEKYPIPYGFKYEEDVNINAPKLYSDTYVLNYLEQMGKIGLNSYSMSLSFSTREDVYSYFSQCLAEADRLLNKTNNVLLSKGLYIRPPYLPIPDTIVFVKKQSFLTGYFGERRPLTGTEITNLYANFQRNALGAATMTGFSQVAKNKEVRQFLVRGKGIAKKHCEIFNSILSENDLNSPMSWDTEVSDSTAYTFSDKLMMFYVTTLIALSVGYYGGSMSMSPRRDIGVAYDRILHEILLYAEDGANIMIKHGWLEEPPRALDRDELAKKK